METTKKLLLLRVAYTEIGTFGVLIYNNIPFAVTLERAWSGNKVGTSCIPEGNYKCSRTLSPKFGDTFEVKEVPGRTHILFHKGNLEEDSHGCILVGEQFEFWSDGRPSILASKHGFEEFLNIFRHDNDFELEIKKAQ